jgi:structure-specific recognition protein 1
MILLVCRRPLALVQKEKAAKKKDPNAPKKALSPYMFFTQEHREIIKEENPGIGFGEVAKKLGAKWKSMSDEDKEVRCVYLRAEYLLY